MFINILVIIHGGVVLGGRHLYNSLYWAQDIRHDGGITLWYIKFLTTYCTHRSKFVYFGPNMIGKVVIMYFTINMDSDVVKSG